MVTSTSVLRIGVIGAGRLGTFHAKKILDQPGVVLAGVADPLARSRELLARECRCPAYADYRALLEHSDAVIIASPTTTHYEVARECLEAGCHVFVEKPLAATGAEAEALVKTANKLGLTLQVGHIERFNPAYRAALPFLRDPWLIEAVREGPFSFRCTDVGCVLDLMVHDLDILRTLARSPLRSVGGTRIAVLGPHEDLAQVELEFADGLVACLRASRLERQSTRRMRVWTVGGIVDIDFASRKTAICVYGEELSRGGLDITKLGPAELEELKDSWETRHFRLWTPTPPPGDPLEAEIQDFIRAIRTGERPQVSGEDGWEAILLAEAVLRRTPIRRVGAPVEEAHRARRRRAA